MPVMKTKKGTLASPLSVGIRDGSGRPRINGAVRPFITGGGIVGQGGSAHPKEPTT